MVERFLICENHNFLDTRALLFPKYKHHILELSLGMRVRYQFLLADLPFLVLLMVAEGGGGIWLRVRG